MNNELSFSQRQGLKSIKSIMQLDSMDAELRNGLWNLITMFYWNNAVGVDVYNSIVLSENPSLQRLFRDLWHNYFKRAIDTLNNSWYITRDEIREYFLFKCEWHEVYDFIEFIANRYENEVTNSEFVEACNQILTREVSGYRFVGSKIAPITSEVEIAEIEEALQSSKSLTPVAAHMKTALDMLVDRDAPDYRNSIKESISAVEALCRIITGSPKATLGQALKQVQSQVSLHPALQEAFNKLYGYTSDEGGIRHALSDEPNVDFEDAKFMLVACSGFVNFLKAKAAKAGIAV